MGNTPNIRFKGFTDDWEQRKFGTIINETRERTTTENEDTLLSCAIDGMFLNSELFSHFRGSSNIGYLKVKKNDLILSAQNLHLGNCNVNLRFEHGIISPAYKVYELIDSDPLFIQAWVKQDSTKDFFLKASTEGASVCRKNIVWEELYKQTLPIPKLEEQTKIGEYFSNLDNLITLHQRKCDETKKLKKFMLQKMFPKKDEKKPEIRFAGFTDDWEQRKLGDIFEQTSNLVNPKVDDIELWSLTVEDGLIKKSDRYNREFLVKKDDNFKEVRPGDIVYNPMNMTLGAVGYNGMEKSVAVSGYYTTMVTKDNYDSYYINTWLKSPQAILLYRTYATGSLIEKQRVQFPTLSIIPVAFPKYEEQVKIGNCFKSIDHLITLHQRKCDELKEFKKYMLQNMFPQKG